MTRFLAGIKPARELRASPGSATPRTQGRGAAGPFSLAVRVGYTPVHAAAGGVRRVVFRRQNGRRSRKHNAARPHTLPGQPAFLRRWFGCLFATTFGVLVCAPIAVSIAVILLHWLGKSDTTDKMAIAASLEVLLGMLVGLVAIFWGLLLTWFGVESAFTIDVSGEMGTAKGKGAFQASAPGLVLFVGGMALVGFCLYKPLQFSQSVPELRRAPIADKPSTDYDEFPSRGDLPKLPCAQARFTRDQMTRRQSIVAALIAISFVCRSARADEPDTRRQAYSDGNKRANVWIPLDDGKCYKIIWHYRSKENGDWQSHEVYWFPTDPDNFYYYNTVSKTFWGRCTKGMFPVWSRDMKAPTLPQFTQYAQYAYTILPYWVKPGFNDLPSVNFDLYPMGKLPPIPESTDGTAMEPPPTPQVLALVPIGPPNPPPTLPK